MEFVFTLMVGKRIMLLGLRPELFYYLKEKLITMIITSYSSIKSVIIANIVYAKWPFSVC